MAGTRGLLPATFILAERPDWIIVRPVLALTIYLEREIDWARGWTAQLFASFRSRAFGPRLRWYATSVTAGWRPLEDGPAIERALVTEGSSRHLLRLRIVDDVSVPETAFTYREVDPTRAGRAGYVQLVFPFDTDTDELLALAIEVAQQTEIACMVGGLALSWNESLPRNAFTAMYRICKRFAGLDIQLPDEASAIAKRALPSVGWLTFVGHRMMAHHDRSAADLGRIDDAHVSAMPTNAGLLFRAGTVPELGDVNAMEDPLALRALTRHLYPLMVTDGLHFPGPFRGAPLDDTAEHTRSWRERLICPERW